MKMCNEMAKLRRELVKRRIKWKDASTISPELTIYRTHFRYRRYKVSVIYGDFTYGGKDHYDGSDKGLLEMQCSCINNGEPFGNLTAEQVFTYLDEIKKK